MLKDLIKSGYRNAPLFVAIHGVEGCGKTTFAGGAPAPLFLDFEQGTNFQNTSRIHPESYKHCTDILTMLETEDHQFQTLVIDSMDFAEVMMTDYVAKRHGKPTMEAFAYGSGYKHLAKEFISFLTKLESLRTNRQMNIIIIAHSLVKKFEDPRLDQGYDRYTIKLYHANAERLKEACDFLLFATFKDKLSDEQNNRRIGQLGVRKLMTERRPAYDAKSRTFLPEELDMSWNAFYSAIYPGQPQVNTQPQQQAPQQSQ